MRESVFGSHLEDDPKRADYVDKLVARVFRGSIRKTPPPSTGGAQRIDCSDGSPTHGYVGAHSHSRGHAGGQG